MRYAEVSVNSSIAQRRTFSYSIPSGFDLEIGQAVRVPFGEKTLQGIVMELTSIPAVAETREIEGLIESTPLLSPVQVALAKWISEYYLAPLFESAALMLPPGFERKVITYLQANSATAEASFELPVEQQAVLEFLNGRDRVVLREAEKQFGVKHLRKLLPHLIKQRLLTRTYTLEKIRVKPHLVLYLFIKAGREEASKILEQIPRSAFKQAELFSYLVDHPRSALSETRQKLGFSAQTVRALAARGLIEVREVAVERDPLYGQEVNLSFPLSLTASQEAVYRAICLGLPGAGDLPSRSRTFLLRGVTGSGKTEVYLRVLAETIKRGRRGIVLVPEIAMTPQMIERFVSRFPGRVAVLHSELPLGMQFDEWWRIKKGEFDVVIGPRSAVFAPQPDLGVIIMDEEHEWTYKQQEVSPHYHTRQAALKLAELSGAALVLGSATPDVESYFRAVRGDYRLLELPERVTPEEGAPLPAVEIVNLKSELKAGNLSLFSRSLYAALQEALKGQHQVILFLNRRGSASFVECRNCSWVVRCKRCDIPLSYHFSAEELVCHQCNYRIGVPRVCPRCHSPRIKYLGAGTEKLEEETRRYFPGARIIRWDSDAVRSGRGSGRGSGRSHQALFAKFKSGEADILIGTQMITKGLDFPGVTLVGVVSADIALNLPDFRAGERAFQLLSQVAGRAGRGKSGGKVIIQTYSPEHYAIKAAARHDYAAFYRQELAYRRELLYPPFSRLARLVYTHSNDMHCQEEAGRIARLLMSERDARGITGLSLIGPAPAFIHRLRSKYRWQLVLRAPDPSGFLATITFPRGWTIDIDPMGLN